MKGSCGLLLKMIADGCTGGPCKPDKPRMKDMEKIVRAKIRIVTEARASIKLSS